LEAPDDELTDYLGTVASWCQLVIVDGSPPDVFAVDGVARHGPVLSP
jgi:hypothetical protein